VDPVSASVLDTQLAYYRARAPEYDRWFRREGRYDRGEAATAAWRRELDEVRDLVRSDDWEGREVLELAAGTGLWTEVLVAAGARVTALDGAPEMLDELTARVGAGRVRTRCVDLFTWHPDRAYDAVVACFFVSHVPDERLDAFCGLLASATEAGGRVLLLDGRREGTSTASDHVLPDGASQTMERRLDDGRAYTIVKRFRTDDELCDALARHGVEAEATCTETYFQIVRGTRA